MNETPKHFVARVAAYLDMDESSSEKEMVSLAESSVTESLMEFHALLSGMVLYGEDKKIEYPIKDRVTLITAHSSKGKEWPVVIVYDTESFKGKVSDDGNDSMDARLFYVSTSRAKKVLYYLKSPGTATIIDDCDLVYKLKAV